MTNEQRIDVYRMLDAEANKAAKALAKAKSAYNNGHTVEPEKAAMLVTLREAQSAAAYKVASEYFNNYIKSAA